MLMRVFKHVKHVWIFMTTWGFLPLTKKIKNQSPGLKGLVLIDFIYYTNVHEYDVEMS